MRLAVTVCAALGLAACEREFHEFDVARPSSVAELPPAPLDAPGRSHTPYAATPRYLAEARPLLPTTSTSKTTEQQPCAVRSKSCEDRLRAVLASFEGQLLALSTPPTELQLEALRLQVEQLEPLLVPYTDITSEGNEIAHIVAKLPSLKPIELKPARRRLTVLTDLIRVQLAAAQ